MLLVLKIVLIGAFVTFISSVEIINSFNEAESKEIEVESFASSNLNIRDEFRAAQAVGKSHRFYYTLGERHAGKN